MYGASSDLKIKEDDKFFARLLSKETSMANPSFRVAVAVPFLWESQPGTPKHLLSEDSCLPPLTPPPSYFSNFPIKKTSKKSLISNLFRILFSPANPKKCSYMRSTTSSSSDGSGFARSRKAGGRRRFTSCRFGFCSSLCYGSTRATQGCY